MDETINWEWHVNNENELKCIIITFKYSISCKDFLVRMYCLSRLSSFPLISARLQHLPDRRRS